MDRGEDDIWGVDFVTTCYLRSNKTEIRRERVICCAQSHWCRIFNFTFICDKVMNFGK